ncbi:MAG: hypothetical protein KAJ19_28195 [Gammaproteobacteria bacterium]|nr:hypothetical protein [Gammaproteobacteria bacterium]
MDKQTITMHKERTTKNTERYEEEVVDGDEPVMKTLYLQKSLGNLPERIQITIEDAPEE